MQKRMKPCRMKMRLIQKMKKNQKWQKKKKRQEREEEKIDQLNPQDPRFYLNTYYVEIAKGTQIDRLSYVKDIQDDKRFNKWSLS